MMWLFSADTLDIVQNTLIFVVLITLGTIAVAYPIALGIAASRRAVWVWVALVLLPKLAGPLTMVMVLQRTLPRGWFAAVVAEIVFVLPYAVLVLVVHLRSIDSTLLATARGLGASSWQTFAKVVWPLSRPAIGFVVRITALWSTGAFVGPLLLAGPRETTLAVELHRQAFDFGRWDRAASVAGVLVVIVTWLGGILSRTYRIHTQFANRLDIPLTFRTLGLFFLALSVAPLGYAVSVSFSPDSFFTLPTETLSFRWYGQFFNDLRWQDAMRTSCLVAVLSSLVAVVAAWPIAESRVSASVVLWPAMIPPVLLGFVLIPLTKQLGPFVTLILAHTLLGLPIAVLILRMGLSESVQLYSAVARGLGANRWQRMTRIQLQLTWRYLLTAFVSVACASWNESVVSVLLATPEVEPLPVVVWSQLRFAVTPLVAVASLVSMVVLVVVVIVVQLLSRVARVSGKVNSVS